MTDRYENIRRALAECRDIAMEWTLRGRIPECGKFGEIAQDLDAVCAELDIADAERDQLAAALEAAREDAEYFSWLAVYPNFYTVCDLLRADQYVTLRRACESLTAIDQARGKENGNG